MYNSEYDIEKGARQRSLLRDLSRAARRTVTHINKFKARYLLAWLVLFLFFWLEDGNSKGVNSEELNGNVPMQARSHWWQFWRKEPNIVIILAANEGGGVLRWKNEQEWIIERISAQNKRAYAKRHGYGLTIKDMTTAKRYSHEFREGWQKVEILRQTMREFPDAEWFWWLDLDTLIMEPSIPLEDHIFKRLDTIATRNLSVFNPLQMETDLAYTDFTQPMELLITQDCGGFNLGSFLIKNSEWSQLLLDVWWDPIAYSQKHMFWEHREQDALESLYSTEPWIRSRVGFLPLRAINSFPPGACSEFKDDPRYFYNSDEHDFVVNMAGCNFGRNCWGEMSHYATLMKKINSRWYMRLFSRS